MGNSRRGICISGGIGSGKSILSRIMRLRGYGVYDCDREAKRLMDDDKDLHREMNIFFGETVTYESGNINRELIAGHIFSDRAKRTWLNEKVHRMVKDDYQVWGSIRRENIFVETAIPVESGLIRKAAALWLVTAEETVRLERVKHRNRLSEQAVVERMNAQKEEFKNLESYSLPVVEIKND